MKDLLFELKRVTKPNSTLSFVIGSSSYNNISVPTDLLIAQIAEEVGFNFTEMRIIRELNKSSQQVSELEDNLPSQRESLLFFSNNG